MNPEDSVTGVPLESGRDPPGPYKKTCFKRFKEFFFFFLNQFFDERPP